MWRVGHAFCTRPACGRWSDIRMTQADLTHLSHSFTHTSRLLTGPLHEAAPSLGVCWPCASPALTSRIVFISNHVSNLNNTESAVELVSLLPASNCIYQVYNPRTMVAQFRARIIEQRLRKHPLDQKPFIPSLQNNISTRNGPFFSLSPSFFSHKCVKEMCKCALPDLKGSGKI